MKYYIILIFIFLFVGLEAQVTIQADVTEGCNPLTVNFNIQPESARDTITSYEWNFGNWTAIRTESSPTITYNLEGTRTVICTINGVSTIEAVDLITVRNCDSLVATNVFTPNDDNLNDYFEVKTDGLITYSFSVYTRAGTLVYKSESPSIIWDGRSLSGQKMKNGIYYYIIRSLKSEPLNELKGIVYLFE
jgi:gliding motility-associated-like protein